MFDLIGRKLGQYEIRATVGQGGMATVYRSYQVSMQRDVAVKVINAQLTGNQEFIERFEREARLIARLQHAHILPVYDFGREGDLVYLVMRLVDGGSLADLLRSRGRLSLSQTARLVSQVASALTYAHNEGVVHRDLKPNNILMDKSSDPYLTDFGIAKLLQSSLALTATGTVMGTPPYMSPEQWRGENVDARSDIYALGVMIYEMLTGDLPFTGETPFALMYKHLDQPPPLVETIADVPNAINSVIQRAMAKDKEARYPSAVKLAEDLNAVATGTQAVVSASDLESTMLGSDVTPLASALPTPILSSGGVVKAPTPPAPPAKEKETKASPPETIPPTAGNRATPKLVHPEPTPAPTRGVSQPLVLAALAVLAVVIVGGYGLATMSQNRETRQPTAAVTQVVVAPTATTSTNTPVPTVSPTQRFRELSKLTGHTGGVVSVAWSNDGSKIASASEDKTIRLWNVETGETVRVLRGHTDQILTMQWSPDNTKIASLGQDKQIRVWNPETGEALKSWSLSGIGGYRLSWSPDSKKIVAALGDGTVYIFDAETGTASTTIKNAGDFINPAAISPNRKILAAAGIAPNTKEYVIRFYNAETGDLMSETLGHTALIYWLTWNKDGSRLASASYDGTVRLWDMTTSKAIPVQTLNASPGSGVSYAAWSPDGQRIASCSGFTNLGGVDDYTIKIWDAESGERQTILEGHTRPVSMVAWSPDGSKLASSGVDQVIRIWAVK